METSSKYHSRALVFNSRNLIRYDNFYILNAVLSLTFYAHADFGTLDMTGELFVCFSFYMFDLTLTHLFGPFIIYISYNGGKVRKLLFRNSFIRLN